MEGYQPRKAQRQFIIPWQEMVWNAAYEFDAIISPRLEKLKLISYIHSVVEKQYDSQWHQ